MCVFYTVKCFINFATRTCLVKSSPFNSGRGLYSGNWSRHTVKTKTLHNSLCIPWALGFIRNIDTVECSASHTPSGVRTQQSKSLLDRQLSTKWKDEVTGQGKCFICRLHCIFGNCSLRRKVQQEKYGTSSAVPEYLITCKCILKD